MVARSVFRVLIDVKEHCAYWTEEIEGWTVGGFEDCYYCGDQSEAGFSKGDSKLKLYEGHASYWMPLPNQPNK